VAQWSALSAPISVLEKIGDMAAIKEHTLNNCAVQYKPRYVLRHMLYRISRISSAGPETPGPNFCVRLGRQPRAAIASLIGRAVRNNPEVSVVANIVSAAGLLGVRHGMNGLFGQKKNPSGGDWAG